MRRSNSTPGTRRPAASWAGCSSSAARPMRRSSCWTVSRATSRPRGWLRERGSSRTLGEDRTDGAGTLAQAFTAWDEGDLEGALEGLQTVVGEADDPERRDLLRRVMVAIFTELGADHPLAREHRRRLAAALT